MAFFFFRDLAAAIDRMEKYNFDKMIYVVSNHSKKTRGYDACLMKTAKIETESLVEKLCKNNLSNYRKNSVVSVFMMATTMFKKKNFKNERVHIASY